ncbi:MAG: hypothetical protein ACLR8P_18350 [Clostridium fessum]
MEQLLNEARRAERRAHEVSGIQRAGRGCMEQAATNFIRLRYQMSNGGNLSVRVLGRMTGCW